MRLRVMMGVRRVSAGWPVSRSVPFVRARFPLFPVAGTLRLIFFAGGRMLRMVWVHNQLTEPKNKSYGTR